MNLHDALAAANIPVPPTNIQPNTAGFLRYGKGYWLKQADGVALFGDYVTGQTHQWFEDSGKPLNTEQAAARKARLADLCKEQEAEQARIHDEVAERTLNLWNSLTETGSSPYLERKQIKAYGARFDNDSIVVPIRDTYGKLWSLQYIGNDGTKRFLAGGKKRGCFHTIGKIDTTLFIAEGYATAASIYMATGSPVIVAFDAGNLEPVVKSLKDKYPALQITLAADNDCWKEQNTGKGKAEAVAQKYGCKIVLPSFKYTSTKPTDFNDLHCLEGLAAVKAQLQTKAKALDALTLHDLLRLEIPPRKMLLAPVIPTQGLVMLYAARGIGKTYVSLSVALSVATGTGTLGDRWKADKARRVLFVDGEMPAIVLQQRLAASVCSKEQELPDPSYLQIITPDRQEFGIPDLATIEGQEAIEQHLEGVELLILDNLSSLCRRGKENEAESWLPVQEWMLSLRKRGISVLLVHHAGKAGAQRGTSKREDLLDTIITLKRPADYESSQGARFEIHYEKARGFHGDDAKPFEASLDGDEFKQRWMTKDIEDSLLERIKALHAEGLKQRDIASEAGCSLSKVNRLLKKAKQENAYE